MEIKRKEKNRVFKKKIEENLDLFDTNRIYNIVYKVMEYKELIIIKENSKGKDRKKKKKIRNCISLYNYFVIFLVKTFMIINIFRWIKGNKLFSYNYQYSKISLKIKGVGENNILGNKTKTNYTFEKINYPDEVKINGIKQDIIYYKYYFNLTNNTVELTWNNSLNNCDYMFYECINITEINFSSFDTSLVTSMNSMFFNCSKLILLDLSNFNTSIVTNMDHIFFNCSSLTSLDLSNFDLSIVTSMNSTFYNCSSLISLNLSNFNTSSVTSMNNTFFNCSKLTELNISTFDTSSVTTMNSTFYNCSKLAFLNLSNFVTSKVTNMDNMFFNCTKLTLLDLSNFDTSKVTNMHYMFYNCLSLMSLNLSNFNTSLVSSMNRMFFNCLSLISLNLSNFNLPNDSDVHNMFYSCTNLVYINLNNLDEGKLKSFDGMFFEVPENVVVCINQNISKIKILPQIITKTCYTIDCSDDWKSKQKKLINNTNQCVESFNNTLENSQNYNDNNVNMTIYDDNNNSLNICRCELDKCLICTELALNNNLCKMCNNNYYPMENEQLNIGNCINCYHRPEGYYLVHDIYKKCYNSCKTCNNEGKNIIHNCIQCKDNYPFSIKNNNYYNCYKKCDYYFYFDEKNNYYCTSNLSCPKEYPILVENKTECIKYDIKDIIINLILNVEKNKTEKSKDEEIKYYDNILQTIENEFTSENYDTSKIDNGQDDIIRTEKITTTLTTCENQKNIINNNVTRIDLGECENLLRNFYNISINESLYIKKIDIIQDGMKTLKVEYNVYSKLT